MSLCRGGRIVIIKRRRARVRVSAHLHVLSNTFDSSAKDVGHAQPQVHRLNPQNTPKHNTADHFSKSPTSRSYQPRPSSPGIINLPTAVQSPIFGGHPLSASGGPASRPKSRFQCRHLSVNRAHNHLVPSWQSVAVSPRHRVPGRQHDVETCVLLDVSE